MSSQMSFDAFTRSWTCECMNYYTPCLECVFKWIFKSISWIRPDRVYWWVPIKDEYNHAFKVLHCKVAGIYRPFTDHCKNCKCWEPRNPVPSPFSAKIRKVNQNLESGREFGMWSGKLGKLGWDLRDACLYHYRWIFGKVPKGEGGGSFPIQKIF